MSTLARIIYDPDTSPPPVPSGLAATVISSSRVDLVWLVSIDTGGSGTSGYLVYRNGIQIGSASTIAYSDTGLAPSTTYQYQVAAVDGAGNVSGLSVVVSATTQVNVGPPIFAPVQPAAAFIGIAGVRAYTDPVQQAAIGRFNWFLLATSGEGWANSGRDLDVSVRAIKAASTAPGGTVLLNYVRLNGILETSNDPYPTYTAEIATRDWRLYVHGSGGALVASPDSSATCLVNYTDFVAVNTSLEHPYDFGAKYSYYMHLSKSKSDARFTGLNAGLASSALDGLFQDNFLLNPQVNGDWNRDGVTEGQGWPGTASPWLQQGQFRYCATMHALAPTKYVFVNGGDYGLVDPGVMAQQADGLLCESYMGKYYSWETQRGFLTTLSYYYKALDAVVQPRLVVFGGSWPDTNADGSALPRLPLAQGFPPVNTQWQWARYIAATAYLGEGMPAISRYSQGYSSDLPSLDWYDFYGGVNGLSRSWLGAPRDALRPITPKVNKGTIGIFGVEYQNGIVLVNPAGNGTQTIVNADIPGNWKFLPGTQDPTRDSGASFTSISMPERDGLFLQRVVVDGVTILGSVVTINRAAGGFGAKVSAAPLYYNNFEGVSVGALPSATGLTNSIDATVVNVQADRSFTGTKCMKGVFPPNTESFPEVSYLPPANTAEIYVSGMVYWAVTNQALSGSPIFKLTRMGAGVLYHGQPSQYQTIRPSAGGVVNGGDWGYNAGGGATTAWCSAMYWGSPNSLPGPHSDQWNFLESAHCIGNPSGSANGYSEMRCNTQNMLPPTTVAGHSAFVNQNTGANYVTGNTNNSGANAFLSWVIPFFDGMSGPGSNAISLWVDELYIDNCRNRVVVTDNAVFANSTPGKFLMLVPSVWNDKQVVGANAALTTLFPPGSTANFHIFTSAGTELINYPKVMP